MIWKNMFSTDTGGEQKGAMTDVVLEKGGNVSRTEKNDTYAYRFRVTVDLKDDNQIGRAALLLASTSTSAAEKELKAQISELDWKSVATEVGGLAGDLPQKLTRALVGASLNAEVIEKNQKEMHALMHASVEAMEGFIQKAMLEASVGAKIAIVRNNKWIAVAVMGDTAYHAVAHHERCGLGVMHL